MTPFAPLELLSPARNLEAGLAAVDHGADAVYIGGPAFGARSAAGNSLADIEKLVRHAHRYRARVYLTLNTIIFDSELEEARRIAWGAWRAGVDALIIQDMGLVECDLPPIDLHASTQCDIRTPQKAAFLDSCGFSQLVLARELTLEQIAACRRAMPRAKIEFFVHGSLCVSYSGQCYLSAWLCGRSANRGACAQPCRLPWDVRDMAGREIRRGCHVLSLKDNDQSGNLEELVGAGVSSFKIEGRLKDTAYVKNTTAWYRKKIDQLLEKHAGEDGWEKSSLGKTDFSFEPDPAKTFHRGATDYFVHGRQPAIAEISTPKSTGEYVGTVVRCSLKDNAAVDVRASATIANGDGLVYRTETGELEGFSVNRVEDAGSGLLRIRFRGIRNAASFLKPGTELRRNRDRTFTRLLAANSARRTMAVDLVLTADASCVTLKARTATSEALFSLDGRFEAALDPIHARESLKRSLSRMGGTPFTLASLKTEGEFLPFLTASVTNSLRRSVLEKLERAIVDGHIRGSRLPRADENSGLRIGHPQAKLDARANIANSRARVFWIAHGAEPVEPAFELGGSGSAGRNFELMRCRHCVRWTLGLCPKQVKGDEKKKADFKRENFGHLKPEPLYLTGRNGERLLARFDCRACEMTVSSA